MARRISSFQPRLPLNLSGLITECPLIYTSLIKRSQDPATFATVLQVLQRSPANETSTLQRFFPAAIRPRTPEARDLTNIKPALVTTPLALANPLDVFVAQTLYRKLQRSQSGFIGDGADAQACRTSPDSVCYLCFAKALATC